MMPQQPLDECDTDRNPMVFGQAVRNLLVRAIGPRDVGAHRCPCSVIRQHLKKGRVQARDALVARLATAAFLTDACVPGRVGIGEFLQPLDESMPVTTAHVGDRTAATAVELADLDRGIPTSVFC